MATNTPFPLNVSDLDVPAIHVGLATKCVRIYQTYACALSRSEQREVIQAMRYNTYIKASIKAARSGSLNKFVLAMQVRGPHILFVKERSTFVRWMMFVSTTARERHLYKTAVALSMMGLEERPACFASYQKYHHTDMQSLELPKIAHLAALCPQYARPPIITTEAAIERRARPGKIKDVSDDHSECEAGNALDDYAPVFKTEIYDKPRSLDDIHSYIIDLCSSSDDESPAVRLEIPTLSESPPILTSTSPSPSPSPSPSYSPSPSPAPLLFSPHSDKTGKLAPSAAMNASAYRQVLASAATALDSASKTLVGLDNHLNDLEKNAASLQECKTRICDLEDLCRTFRAELATEKRKSEEASQSIERLERSMQLAEANHEHYHASLERVMEKTISDCAKKHIINAKEDIDRYLTEIVPRAVGDFLATLKKENQERKKNSNT